LSLSSPTGGSCLYCPLGYATAEIAKSLKIPEGEILNFTRESIKVDSDERARQREQDKQDKIEEEQRRGK